MERAELEKQTRNVFDGLHKSQGRDATIFALLSSMLTTEYLKVEDDWFVGKTCLDAGCGSNAHATYSMLRMGAEKVYAFDLDSGTEDTILDSVPEFLQEFEDRYELSLSNVLDLAYPDDFFDFTHCSGVLHHTHDVFKGLSELGRVTKVGGTLYAQVNGKGGLVREFLNFLRDKYARDAEFKSLIDDLSEQQFVETFRWIAAEGTAHGDPLLEKLPSHLFEELFDRDLVLSIKDRIIAPVYHENTEEDLVNWFLGNGFTHVERLTRYPKFKNIRRFLSPLYNSYDHPTARLLYGSGAIQLKGVKSSGKTLSRP